MRNEDIYIEPTFFENDITINEDEFYQIISKSYDSDEGYVRAAADAVNQAIAHYWDENEIEKYNLRIPIYENYLLFLFYHFFPNEDQRHEFCNYRKAVERGVGFCSQQAIILDAILDERGIPSKIVSFPWLHVITTVQVDPSRGWWLVDPDFGVVIPHDMDAVAKDPQLAAAFYQAAGYDAEIIDYVENAFSTEYLIADSVDQYFGTIKCQIERASYTLKWIFPIILMIIGSLPYVRNMRNPAS